MKNKLPLTNDELKYKKKSKAKGQPRANHKHEYKTVLLHSFNPHYIDKDKLVERLTATKVCSVCGRINGTDYKQYGHREVTPPSPFFKKFIEEYIKDPETLENWYAYGYLPKTAYKTLEEAKKENIT